MVNNKSNFHFTNVTDSQINIAQDQAKITANLNTGSKSSPLEQELNKLIQLVQESTELSQEEKDEIVRRGNEVLADVKRGTPRRNVIAQLNEKLGKVSHLIASGSLLAGSISAVTDLLQAFGN